MADSKRAEGRGRDIRFLVRGCPRCRGTLEWLAERGAGSLVMFRWHCLNCGRSYSEDAFLLGSSLPNLAGTGAAAGSFKAFSSQPAGAAPGKARAR